jgi:phage-related baseplate assembly protein
MGRCSGSQAGAAVSAFTAVDLSRLPLPDVFEQVSFEQLLEQRVADFRRYMPEFTALVEPDPLYKSLQASAYRELVLREQFNQRAKGLFLAYAQDGDLDNLGAPFGVTRKELTPADEDAGTPAIYESDAEFRRRIQLSPEGLSVAGPEGAYIFHTLGADPRVLDASASSPRPDDLRSLIFSVLQAHEAPPQLMEEMASRLDAAVWPGTVVVSVLSREGNGSADPDLVEAVDRALSSQDVRPLTDEVAVASAEIRPYEVVADLFTFDGPDGEVVLREAERRLTSYQGEAHRLGRNISLSALYAQLHAEGVQRVVLHSPSEDLVVDRHQAAYCTAVSINHVGTDE